MNDLNSLASHYIDVWNETKADQRKMSIKELWSEDATHFTSSLVATGHDEIEARIERSHETNVGSGGFIFKLSNHADGHHNAMKFSWVMVPKTGGNAAAAGTVFVLLNEDGKIRSDYQFTETLPSY